MIVTGKSTKVNVCHSKCYLPVLTKLETGLLLGGNWHRYFNENYKKKKSLCYSKCATYILHV